MVLVFLVLVFLVFKFSVIMIGRELDSALTIFSFTDPHIHKQKQTWRSDQLSLFRFGFFFNKLSLRDEFILKKHISFVWNWCTHLNQVNSMNLFQIYTCSVHWKSYIEFILFKCVYCFYINKFCFWTDNVGWCISKALEQN